jgi:hypothetical protein
MPTLVSHTQYLGDAPSITLTGGSTATDRVVIVISGSGGDGSVFTGATLAANAATLLGNAVNSGGTESSVAALDMQNPGSGTYAAAFTKTAGAFDSVLWDVYEFSAAASIANFTSNAVGGFTTVPFNVALASNSAIGDTVVWAASGADGQSVTSTIAPDLVLSSSLIARNATINRVISRSGYRTSAATNETVTFTYGNFSTTGGAVDRATVVSFVVAEGVVPPSITINQTEITPGGTISGSYANWGGTAPALLEAIRAAISLDSNNQITGLVITGDGVSGTYTATMPDLPTVGNAQYLRFSDADTGIVDPTWRLS